MPRPLCVFLGLSLIVAIGCTQETPKHPTVKFVPDKIKNVSPAKDPAPNEKDPPKYKLQ